MLPVMTHSPYKNLPTDNHLRLPVTEDIYTRHECELRLKYIAKRRPNLYFMCNEVMRENGSGDDDSPGIPDDPEDTLPPDEQP